MKFSCVILICPMVIALAMASAQLTYTTFDECKPGEWIVTNTTIDWKNETKTIVFNITYSQENDPKIYMVHIVINGCNNRTKCTGEPQVWIDDVDCNETLSDPEDIDACRVADEIGKREKEIQYLNFRYGRPFGKMLYNWTVCINLEDISLSISPDDPNNI